MPSIGDWRGAATAEVHITATPANRHSAWVTTTTASPEPAANQAIWEGAPGTAITLRFKWTAGGTGSAQQAPTFATVEMRVPSGAIVGAAWTVAFPAANTEVVRTFHFDDDPLNQVAAAIREGTLEIYLNWGSAGGAVPWSIDSRGGSTGTILTTNTLNWASGRLRAPVALSSYSVSNASLGGSEPASFAFPHSVFQRLSLDAIWYRSAALAIAWRQSGSDRRTDSVSQTAVQHDYTWNTTAITVAGLGRINNGQYVTTGATVTQVRLSLPATTFGGDLEYVWASQGLQLAGWTRASDTLLTEDDRVTVDPRITFSRLMQLNSSTFLAPPTAGESVPAGQRLSADLAFLAARAVNALGAGVNSLVWTEKLWDTGQLTGTEASPVASRTTTSAAQGGQDGWSDGFLTWDESLPGGSWAQKEVITTADATGLEVSNTRTLTLITSDPRTFIVVGAGDTDKPGRHWSPGQKLVIELAIFKAFEKIAPQAGTAMVALSRFKPSAGRLEYLNASLEWVEWTGPEEMPSFTMTASAGDAELFLKTFTAAETGITTPANKVWNTEDLFITATAKDSGGVAYYKQVQMGAVGKKNRHDVYAFNATGLDK